MNKQFKRRFYLLGYPIAFFIITGMAISCQDSVDDEPLIEEIETTLIESNTDVRLTRIQLLEDKTIGFISGEEGVLLKTTNSGDAWSVIETGLTNDWNSVWFTDEQTGFLVANEEDDKFSVFKTTNGGTVWKDVTVTGGKVDRIYDIGFANSTTGWMVGDEGQIFKSTDGGENWNIKTSIDTLGMRQAFVNKYIAVNPGETPGDDQGTLADTRLRRLKVVSENEIYTGGEDGTVFKSTDGGENWKYLETGNLNRVYDLNYVNNSLLIACGSNGSVSKVYSDGTYEDATNNANTRSFRGMHFITEDVGWCVGEHGYIYKTNNGGKNWGTEIAPTESTYILYGAVFTNPQTGFFVGNSGRIIKIEDASTENITQQ